MAPAGLSIAVVISAPEASRWQARCMDLLCRLPDCAVRLIILSDAPSVRDTGVRWLAQLLQRFLGPRGCRPATRLPEGLQAIERLTATELQSRVESGAFDAVIDGCPDAWCGTPAAGRRLWFVVEPRGNWGGDLAGLLPGNRRQTTIRVQLYASDNNGAHGVVRQGRFRWRPHRPGAALDVLLDQLAGWPAAVLNRPQRFEPDTADIPAIEQVEAPTSELSAPRLLFEGVFRLLWRGLRKPFERGAWGIGLVRRPIAACLPGEGANAVRLRDIEWLDLEPAPEVAADPFGVEIDGRLAVLFERILPGETRGEICHLELDGEAPGKVSGHTVINAPTHLSYPYLFEHEGEFYCIPESSQARKLLLYRATDFPRAWELHHVLMEDVELRDTTLIRFQERWWLLAGGPEDNGCLNLLVFHADSFTGPWVAHPGNPVKTDCASVRPAGTPFVHDGRLYRPAQDGSERYGGRAVLCRIDELNPERFRETVVGAVEPDPAGPYPHGIHTLAAAGDFTLVDGYDGRFAAGALFGNLYRFWAARRGRK